MCDGLPFVVGAWYKIKYDGAIKGLTFWGTYAGRLDSGKVRFDADGDDGTFATFLPSEVVGWERTEHGPGGPR